MSEYPKPATRKQLVNVCYMLVRCWDRSTAHADFAEQAGAHIESMRDLVRHEHLKPVRSKRSSKTLADVCAPKVWDETRRARWLASQAAARPVAHGAGAV